MSACPMDLPNFLTALSVLATLMSALLVLVTFFEYFQMRDLKKQFQALRDELTQAMERQTRANHRVLASYGVADPDRRLELLKSAEKIDPTAFNLYNAMGFAWLDKGYPVQAIDAFHRAIRQRPNDKAGYFDLAWAYLQSGNEDSAVLELSRAIDADPSARDDLRADERFRSLANRVV